MIVDILYVVMATVWWCQLLKQPRLRGARVSRIELMLAAGFVLLLFVLCLAVWWRGLRPKKPVLPVTVGKKLPTGGGEKIFVVYFYIMMCRVILPNKSQKQTDTLNSTHENLSNLSAF